VVGIIVEALLGCKRKRGGIVGRRENEEYWGQQAGGRKKNIGHFPFGIFQFPFNYY
jgi:hypothetical protein